MRCSIKRRVLPSAPAPTKPQKVEDFYTGNNGEVIRIHRPISKSFTKVPPEQSTENRQKAQEYRAKEAKAKHETVRQMHEEGFTTDQIREATGYSWRTIRGIIGGKEPPKDMSAAQAARHEKSRKRREQAFKMREDGKTAREIAAELGITPTMVRRMFREEKTWT